MDFDRALTSTGRTFPRRVQDDQFLESPRILTCIYPAVCLRLTTCFPSCENLSRITCHRWWLCDMAFYGFLLPPRHFFPSTRRRWWTLRHKNVCRCWFRFSSFDHSLWHSQAGDSIPKFNRWISNFMSLNIFSTWDNIWLFNGATYFMKSTNKYFVTSREHHKKSQFYWNPIINKPSFVDVMMIVFEMMMTSFPPRKTDWVVRRCSAPQKHSIDGAKKEKGQRKSVQSFIELDSKFIFALVHQNKLAGPKITKKFHSRISCPSPTHTLTKRISWRFNFYLFSLLIYLCKWYAFETECL